MAKTYVLKITTLNGTQYKNCSSAKKALYNLYLPSLLKISPVSSDNILKNNSKKKKKEPVALLYHFVSPFQLVLEDNERLRYTSDNLNTEACLNCLHKSDEKPRSLESCVCSALSNFSGLVFR